ncbi:MAG TPA: ABC transporter permease [Opitutaceae bacterium]|nr:ABC transporter permease [Opitutaceae bacterium]
MFSDLRLSVRSLAKTPGFTLVAILTLALGVGANTAIFSVINAVLLHPFPYAHSDRLLFIGETMQGQTGVSSVTYPDYLDWRAASHSFEGLAYARGRSYTLTNIAEPAVVRGAAVSASVWPLLGIQPMLGRTFTEAEDRPGAPPVCVLSYATWQNRFGGDPAILGHPLTLDGQSYAVIGVMPPVFKFWAGDIWLPAGLEADTQVMRSRVLRFDSWVVGTPKPGISAKDAEAELNVIAARVARQHPESNKGVGASVRLLSESVVGDFRQPLFVLLAAVACVLLIACANVANLLLARAATRQHEFAVRIALGANRRRIVRQVLLETLPLAVLGGLAGVLLGSWELQALLLILPPDAVPAEAQIQVNWPVMLASLGLVVSTMALFSLFPALSCSRPSLTESLQENSRGGTSGIRTGRLRAMLVVAEVGLSVTLLVGSGLLLRSLARLYFVDPGFKPDHLLVVPIQLPDARYPTGERATAFFTDLLQNVQRLPQVKVAAATTNAPFVGGSGIPLVTEGQTYRALSDLKGVQFSIVMGDYFRALGLRLVKGRTFNDADRAGSAPVVILNEAAVKQFLPHGNPLGQRVMLGVPDNLIKPGLLPPGLDKFHWSTVVGVVTNSRHFGLQNDPPPVAYLPVDQSWTALGMRSAMTLMVRTTGDPTAVAHDIRQMVASSDRDQPVGRIATMDAIIAESLRTSRFNTILLGLFAAIALVLAVVGIYGVVAWNVAQRTREFGIRQALGAQPADVIRSVVFRGVRVVLIGVVLGLAGALGAGRLLQGMLFQVGTFDPWTFAGVVALLVGVAILACIIPALRALRVDPVTALRAE